MKKTIAYIATAILLGATIMVPLKLLATLYISESESGRDVATPEQETATPTLFPLRGPREKSVLTFSGQPGLLNLLVLVLIIALGFVVGRIVFSLVRKRLT